MIKDETKHTLKQLSEKEIKTLIAHEDLTDDERWILYYTYIKKNYVINTCIKLNISERQYHIIHNEMLIKLHYIFK